MKIMKKVLISLALASAFIGLGTANAEVKTSYKPNPRIISGKAAICIGTHESEMESQKLNMLANR